MMKLVRDFFFFPRSLFPENTPWSFMFVVLGDQVGGLLEVLGGLITRKRYRSPDCELWGRLHDLRSIGKFIK